MIVSAKAENLDRIKGWESGTDAYLVKPYSHKELEAILLRLIQNRKLMQDKYLHQILAEDMLTDKNPFIQKVEGHYFGALVGVFL